MLYFSARQALAVLRCAMSILVVVTIAGCENQPAPPAAGSLTPVASLSEEFEDERTSTDATSASNPGDSRGAIRNDSTTAAPSGPGGENPEKAAKAKPADEHWGDLRGRFVFGGERPVPEPIRIQANQNPDYCGKHKPVIEQLVVDEKSKGVANVFVWLAVKRGAKQPPIHPSFDETRTATVTIDNKGCRFEPHALFLRAQQTLRILNSDTIGHNTNVQLASAEAFNQNIPPGSNYERQLKIAMRQPSPINCNVHPFMAAWVFVSELPYVAVAGNEGEFEIKNLPAGKWTFKVWHEKAGALARIGRGGKTETWTKGESELEIKSGQNDLGELTLAPDLFRK